MYGYEFFEKCTSLNDAARKIFGKTNYRLCEKIKIIALENGFDWQNWHKKTVKYCKNCGKEIISKDSRTQFCSHSCAATYNNLHRTIRDNNKSIPIRVSNCILCGKEIYGGYKYCSSECQQTYQHNEWVKKWKDGNVSGTIGKYEVSSHIRRYLFDKYNCKCQKCGWGEVNKTSNKVPLQIHHIDGNCLNNKEENLELLCPNCHSLTDTYGSLNESSNRIFRKQKGNT